VKLEGLEGKVTVIVRVALRAPVALAVKPTVQVAAALAASELPLNVTPAGVVAAAIATADAGLTLAVSTLVFTLNVPGPYEGFATGFVIPSIVTVPAALLASAQVLGRVIVTVWPTTLVLGLVQVPVKLPPRVIAGLVRAGNAGSKVTVIVLPALRVPVLLVVKPTAHEAVAAAVCGVPVKETAVTEVGAAMFWSRVGLAGRGSELVLTLNVFAR
jgi:hypothetical protein